MNLETRIRSTMMGLIGSTTRRSLTRALFRFRRTLAGAPPVVHYFHDVTDPYSHLAVQKLAALQARYPVVFRFYLTSSPPAAAQGDSTRFAAWALHDARSIAAYYQTSLPEVVDRISPIQAIRAASRLAPVLDSSGFAELAVEIGDRLWQGQEIDADDDVTAGTRAIDHGNALRQKWGHYLSGTFYFEGEWYWGVDRLFHLEQRLCSAGYSIGPDHLEPAHLVVPRPTPISATGRNASGITLEYFPSLRSPYTAISFDRTIDLVKRSGVNLILRPVMPMLMRGVPAPRAKQMYIMTDCKREAEAAGVPFGPFVDPFGEPVKRAFSLFPALRNAGKAAEFISAYLKAAWAEGRDITTENVLRSIVESTGTNWATVADSLDTSGWEDEIETNVQAMLTAGLWGVPSFRITGGNTGGNTDGNTDDAFVCWGQDRLWRVETEISLRATSRAAPTEPGTGKNQ